MRGVGVFVCMYTRRVVLWVGRKSILICLYAIFILLFMSLSEINTAFAAGSAVDCRLLACLPSCLVLSSCSGWLVGWVGFYMSFVLLTTLSTYPGRIPV